MKENLPLIAKLFEDIRLLNQNERIQLYLLAVILFAPVLWFLVKKLQKIRSVRKLHQDLHPYFSIEEVNRATRYYVPTKCQNVAPSREQEPRRTFALAVRSELMQFFLKDAFSRDRDDQRFYLILADSGMGKTTFMINLYLNYITNHGRPYNIRLIPLGHPKSWETISHIDDDTAKNTILLLDAFDEDSAAASNYVVRLNELVNKG